MDVCIYTHALPSSSHNLVAYCFKKNNYFPEKYKRHFGCILFITYGTCNKNDLNRITLKNEPVIEAHELNVDEKNFSLLNTTQTNLTLEASTAINPLELNLDEKHSLLIDSVRNRIASFSRNIGGLAEVSLSQSSLRTKETLNPHELNVDSKSITLLNMSSTANQSSFLVNESSLNSHELNIDSRLVNMTNSSYSTIIQFLSSMNSFMPF